jgi:hypothetical protein
MTKRHSRRSTDATDVEGRALTTALRPRLTHRRQPLALRQLIAAPGPSGEASAAGADALLEHQLLLLSCHGRRVPLPEKCRPAPLDSRPA